jgi:hypothetical protein
LAYYIYFSIRGHKGKEPYNIYKAVLGVALIASIGCFLEPFSAALKPYNELLLYFFVVSVMTVDLIGTTLGPMVLQASVNPAIFRQVYQHIITQELIARIVAAALVWLLSQGHLLVFLYPVAWAMLIAHFILFDLTIWRMRVSEIKTRIPEDQKQPAMESLADSIRFVFANPLVRAAMVMMAWSTVTKFVLENLFYQVADAEFSSARQIAAFVSAMTIIMYLLSLAMHHVINSTLNKRLQLSALLSVQPINILVLGGIALLVHPFWPLVVLMVTYNIIHRSIQLPMSRQCLVPVPRQRRGTIVGLISIVVSLAAMLTSGAMAALKNSLHLQDFLIVLLLLGGSIFFVITSLDSYYIRNLWSFFKEGRSGSWQEEPPLDGLSGMQLDLDSASIETPAADIKSNPILNAYAFSRDREYLFHATREHHALLQSNQPELLLSGLRVCYVADFPWFADSLRQAANHKHPLVRSFAEHAASIKKDFNSMAGYSSAFRRKIKTVAMNVLETGDKQASESIAILKNLLNNSDHKGAASIVNLLADNRYSAYTNLILSCVAEGGNQLTVAPIVACLYKCQYPDAQPYRQHLINLAFGKKSPALRDTIYSKLIELKQSGLNLGDETSKPDPLQLLMFMHTLFLEEYRISESDPDRALSDTIAEFQIFSSDERAVLVDMHLSFLKRSEFFDRWQEILS